MLFTFRYCFSFFLLALLVFKADPSGAQPSLLNKRITVSCSEMPVSSILQQLGKESGIRFSYDPVVVSAARRTTLRAVNQPLGDVLKALFNDSGILYHEIGNQLVIYRNTREETVPSAEPARAVLAEKNAINTAQFTAKVLPFPEHDTVFFTRRDTLIVSRTDTLIKKDTLILHDTIIHRDTVFVEKTNKAQKTFRNTDPRFDRNSMKNQKFKRNNGFYGGISYEQFLGTAGYKASSAQSGSLSDLMKGSVSATAMNYSVGLSAGYDYLRLGIRSGLSYTRLGEAFQYSFIQQEGGFYKKDTVEKYYTLSGSDTSWYFVTDSSWVNSNSKKYTYKNPNSYRYVEIPFMLKFRVFQGDNAEIYGIGGIIAGMYFGGKALIILEDADHTVTWTSSLQMNPVVISWQAGAGTAINFSNRLGVFAELLYRKQLSNQYRNYAVQKKFELLNIKTGIFVRF